MLTSISNAEAHEQLDDLDKALADIETAIRLKPDDAAGWNWRGSIGSGGTRNRQLLGAANSQPANAN